MRNAHLALGSLRCIPSMTTGKCTQQRLVMKGDYFGSAYRMASFRCSKWQPDRDRRERLAKMPDEKGVEWGAGAGVG